MSAAASFFRTFPGVAQLHKQTGEPQFIRGRVIYSSPRIQWVETESKLHPLVALLGDSYLYWCRRCQRTVLEYHVLAIGAHLCPDCRQPVEFVLRGTKVRLHFRFAVDGNWAQWYAERWDW